MVVGLVGLESVGQSQELYTRHDKHRFVIHPTINFTSFISPPRTTTRHECLTMQTISSTHPPFGDTVSYRLLTWDTLGVQRLTNYLALR